MPAGKRSRLRINQMKMPITQQAPTLCTSSPLGDKRRGTLRLPRKVQVLNMLEDVERETDSVDYTPFEILTLGWPVE